jgi:hypothetical protein
MTTINIELPDSILIGTGQSREEFVRQGVAGSMEREAEAQLRLLQYRDEIRASSGTTIAIMAHDGFARALWPSHTPFDGDLVFALATGRVAAKAPAPNMVAIGAAAAACVSRAIARGIYAATPAPGDRVPTWNERFGSGAAATGP